MSDFAKIVIALIIAAAFVQIMKSATLVGIERTRTCRAQPQLCDTHLSPRAEVPE